MPTSCFATYPTLLHWVLRVVAGYADPVVELPHCRGVFQVGKMVSVVLAVSRCHRWARHILVGFARLWWVAVELCVHGLNGRGQDRVVTWQELLYDVPCPPRMNIFKLSTLQPTCHLFVIRLRCRREVCFSWVSAEVTLFGLFQLFVGGKVRIRNTLNQVQIGSKQLD